MGAVVATALNEEGKMDTLQSIHDQTEVRLRQTAEHLSELSVQEAQLLGAVEQANQSLEEIRHKRSLQRGRVEALGELLKEFAQQLEAEAEDEPEAEGEPEADPSRDGRASVEA
jgi:chromosome segregation ATPase